MVNSLENIDKSKVYVDRIEGLDEVVEGVVDNTLIGAVSTITKSDLTAGKVLVSDNNGKVAAGSKGINDLQDALVSGTNIKTINGSSILGSGNIAIESGSDIDNLSITKNASDKLQTVGVINQNAPTAAIKTWTGTLAQYDAIATKDNNTLYNITDDMQAITYEAYSKNETDALLANSISTLLSNLYPVGSIYIGTQSTCPLATLISGSTWVKVSEGRVLQGSDSSHSAGTTIAAGLPNITGEFAVKAQAKTPTGAFYTISTGGGSYDNNFTGNEVIGFNASISNSIYGNSNTVQPPAYVVNIWQRTA